MHDRERLRPGQANGRSATAFQPAIRPNAVHRQAPIRPAPRHIKIRSRAIDRQRNVSLVCVDASSELRRVCQQHAPMRSSERHRPSPPVPSARKTYPPVARHANGLRRPRPTVRERTAGQASARRQRSRRLIDLVLIHNLLRPFRRETASSHPWRYIDGIHTRDRDPQPPQPPRSTAPFDPIVYINIELTPATYKKTVLFDGCTTIAAGEEPRSYGMFGRFVSTPAPTWNPLTVFVWAFPTCT